MLVDVPLVLLLCGEVLLGSLQHPLHVVGLIHILTAILAHPQPHHSSILLNKDALQRSRPVLRLLVLDHQDVLIGGDLIEIDVAVELIDPLIGVGDLQLQRSEHLVLVVDLLAVQPGVAVVELEHVQSALDGVHRVLQLAHRLLVGEQQRLHGFGACDLAEVVESQGDVVVRHVDAEVKDGEVFEDLEVAEGSGAALDADLL